MIRKPIEPVSPERRELLKSLQGCVILGRHNGDNHYKGYVEHSFSMGWDSDYVCFWWSGEATSNIGSKHILDGKKEAENIARDLGYDVEAWDVHDENLPVILDWDGWIDAQAYDPNTLSGVSNKFKARNFKFEMKE